MDGWINRTLKLRERKQSLNRIDPVDHDRIIDPIDPHGIRNRLRNAAP